MPMVHTTQWVQCCPVCASPGRRAVDMIALDAECTVCRFFYTSHFKRAVLNALSRSKEPRPC